MLSVRDARSATDATDAVDRRGIAAPSIACLGGDGINSLDVMDGMFDMRSRSAVVGGVMAIGEEDDPLAGAGRANKLD